MKSFLKWPSKELRKSSPQKATKKLQKIAKNNHFRVLEIDQRCIKMQRNVYSRKTIKPQKNNGSLCSILSWGCFHPILLYFYQGMASFKKYHLFCHTEIEKAHVLRCCQNQQQSLWPTVKEGQYHCLYEVTTLVGISNRPTDNQKFYGKIQ